MTGEGPLEPLPETDEALRALDRLDDGDLREELEVRARMVQAVAPACVALSLTSVDHGLTLTLVASSIDVASTLTLPLRSGDEVVGSVEIYGGTPDAFEGRHEALAGIFGAWAVEAVADADLSFRTRRAARRAAVDVRAEATIARAVGMVAERAGVDVTEARRRVRDSAERVGIDESTFARHLLGAAGQEDTDES